MKPQDREFIDHLKSIHHKCKTFLDVKDFEGLANYLLTFTLESDVNELKTILMITKPFKDMYGFQVPRDRIKGFYELKIGHAAI